MRINLNNKGREWFQELKNGETFIQDDDAFMKISSITDEDNDVYNAILLKDGSLIYFYDADEVTPAEFELNQI